VLKAYIDAYGGTCGVFLDVCSLHQKGPAGEQRSDAEGELFGFALKCLSDWYSHPNTMVLKATKIAGGLPKRILFRFGHHSQHGRLLRARLVTTYECAPMPVSVQAER
jgi:hypothetical protein